MPRIKTVSPGDATGELAKQYEAAQDRAGHICNIVSIMSQNPLVLKTSLEFYGALMHGPSSLSRGQREMLAVVVSARNHCVY